MNPHWPDRESERHEPYSVEQFPSVAGTTLLIGYDRRGELMAELRLPAARVTEKGVQEFCRWMMENDDAYPHLSLVP